MQKDRRSAGLGGGVFIAIGPLAGLVLGFAAGEPSIGIIGGVVAGAAIATAFWWLNR